MNKTKDSFFPIQVETYEHLDSDLIQFYNVDFLEDFGIFKKGDNVDVLCLNFTTRTIEEYKKNDKNIVRTQKFKTIPNDTTE